jgi:hypothetical protein
MYDKLVREITKASTTIHGLPVDALKKRSRKREVVNARFQAIALVKENTKLSLSAIGMKFGRLDHSSVIHAINTHQNYLQVDKDYRNSFAQVKAIVLPMLHNEVPTDIEEVNKRIEEIKKILYSSETIDTEYFRPYKDQLNVLMELHECLTLNKHIVDFGKRLKQLPTIHQTI